MTKQELLDKAKTYQNVIFSIAPSTRKTEELTKVRLVFQEMEFLYNNYHFVSGKQDQEEPHFQSREWSRIKHQLFSKLHNKELHDINWALRKEIEMVIKLIETLPNDAQG